MTALIESLTWWPWTAGPIRNVQRNAEAPGMVTLSWHTDDAVPTRLAHTDGSPLYVEARPRQDHQVTLTGWAGMCEDIVIQAGADHTVVEVAF